MNKDQLEIVENICLNLKYMSQNLEMLVKMIDEALENISDSKDSSDVLYRTQLIEDSYRQFVFNSHRALRLARYAGALSAIEKRGRDKKG